MSKPKPKIITIVGPTASGKTALSITLSKQFSGEVISADSRQVYRELDIGTAKITQKEMTGIPHHLINILNISEKYTGHQFVQDAQTAISDIYSRHHLPIIAGGTFFYLDLLRGKQQVAAVPTNDQLRAEIETKTLPELQSRLATYGSQYLESIDTSNPRRIIRALEILAALGEIPKPTQNNDSSYDFLLIGLRVGKEVLRARYRTRAAEWLKNGFLNEIEGLLEQGITAARLQEIGFEYTLGVALLKEEISASEFTDRFEQKNWQYAKRQYTWLKRDPDIVWYEPGQTAAIVERVTHYLND